MDIIFMGTPLFAVTSLQRLCEAGHHIVLIVAQPDRPQGRGMKLKAPPVKEAACALGLESVVLQPERLRQPEALAQLLAVPTDLVITAAYGQLLPDLLLRHPRIAAINVHASLLPHYRGAAPIQRVLMNGERETGITIMHMAEKLDVGDIIMQRRLPIEPTMNYSELHDALALLGAELLLEACEELNAGRATRRVQDEAQASYAPLLKSEDRHLDWSRPAETLRNQVRALDPAPGAETTVHGQRVKIWNVQTCSCPETELSFQPGRLLSVEQGWPVVAAGQVGIQGLTCLKLCEVQPAGKRRMSAEEWLKGSRLQPGLLFGDVEGEV